MLHSDHLHLFVMEKLEYLPKHATKQMFGNVLQTYLPKDSQNVYFIWQIWDTGRPINLQGPLGKDLTPTKAYTGLKLYP